MAVPMDTYRRGVEELTRAGDTDARRAMVDHRLGAGASELLGTDVAEELMMSRIGARGPASSDERTIGDTVVRRLTERLMGRL